MNTDRTIAWTLRFGIIIGFAWIVVGLLFPDSGNTLYGGVLILIMSPFLAVIAALICLMKEKDRFWSMIAAILIIVICIGIAISAI